MGASSRKEGMDGMGETWQTVVDAARVPYLFDHQDLAWHWLNVYVLVEVTAEDEARLGELLLACVDDYGDLVR